MKVVAFNGSARKDGNTAILIRKVFSELEAEGIETELVQMAGKKIRGCIACGKCFKNQDGRCAVDNDAANECIEKMAEADGIILGSPTYFSDLTAEMKALRAEAGRLGDESDALFGVRNIGYASIDKPFRNLFKLSSRLNKAIEAPSADKKRAALEKLAAYETNPRMSPLMAR